MAVVSGPLREAAEEPIADGDLELVIHPGTKEWLVFAVDSARTTAHRVPDPSSAPDALARALLGPLGQQPGQLLPQEARVLEDGAALADGLAELVLVLLEVAAEGLVCFFSGVFYILGGGGGG